MRRRPTCSSSFAMSTPRPRTTPNPNAKPYIPFSSTSATQPPSHRWCRPFSQSATGPADPNNDSSEPLPRPHQQCPPRLGLPYAPSHGPYKPPQPSHRPPSPGSIRPPPRESRSSSPIRPPDYRSWIPTRFPPPPPQHERFRVLSYNILADYLAREHRSKLYFHIPMHTLDWEWRKRRIFLEIGLWSADIMCLQEVDRFPDLQDELALRGYQGTWKMRTGAATDGCAIFWRTNRFQLRHEECIEFNKLGLRDNVAQLCVLESRRQPMQSNFAAAFSSDAEFRGSNKVVVCNIHVLYNPKRGEVKLGQVRTLIDRALAVSRLWNDAPVVICGDFNSTPKSPLYNFISEQKLDLSGLCWDQVSGQYSCSQVQACRDDSVQRLHISQENSYVKATTVTAGDSVVEIPIERTASNEAGIRVSLSKSPAHFNISEGQMHIPSKTIKYENILEKDDETPDPTGKLTDEISQLHPSDAEAQVAVDTLAEDAVEDYGFHEPTNRKENVFPVTFVKEDFVTREISPGSTSENAAGMQMLSQSASTDNEVKLQPEIKIFSSDSFTFSGKEEHFGPTSCASSFKTLDVPSDQELALPSSKADIKEMNKNIFVGNQDTLETSREMTLHKNGSNKCTVSNHLQDSKQISNNLHDELIFEEESAGGDFITSSRRNGSIDGIVDDSLEEVSDPNFLAELHGKENNDEVNEKEILASNTRMQTGLKSYSGAGVWSYAYPSFHWTPEQIEIATGDAECFVLRHYLKLKSAYAEAKDFVGTKDPYGEPQVTSYHRKFMGTVDYIWLSEGLQAVKVLDTIKKGVLQQTPGFPTRKWGSDHIAIACEFAFSKQPAV